MFNATGAGRQRQLAGFFLLLLFPVIGGCASTPGETGNPLGPAASEDGEDIELLVRNLNFHQITVYAARGGTSVRRLGTVPGKGEATFRLRWHLPDLQLRVRELAGPEYLTETLPVSPGDLLEFIVPAR